MKGFSTVSYVENVDKPPAKKSRSTVIMPKFLLILLSFPHFALSRAID
jgi:hypothetical protein